MTSPQPDYSPPDPVPDSSPVSDVKDASQRLGATLWRHPVSALEEQVAGTHYKWCKIQPAVFIHANKLGWLEGCIIARVVRHNHKNGKEDLEKAIHELQLLIELEYPS